VSVAEANAAGFAEIAETYSPANGLADYVQSAKDSMSRRYLERFHSFDKATASPITYGVYRAENVKLWPEYGVHCTSKGSLSDVYCNRAALANPKYEVPRLALPLMPVGREYGECIFLGPAWYHNHYHWLGDILTRLDLVRKELAAGIPLVVPPTLRSVQRDALMNGLRAAGAPEARIIQPDQRIVRFRRLHMPTQMARPLDITPRQLGFLRAAMLPKAAGTLGKSRRIYVSRSDAAIRRVANEAEVETRLHRLGFETVKLAQLPFVDQVALFADAECVVGHHGAGHANVAFCPRGAKVIEIFQDGHFSPRFARMSQVGGLQYGYAVGASAGRDTIAPIGALDELMERLSID
jgi:capsular polysaccharide biosynthesis protein